MSITGLTAEQAAHLLTLSHENRSAGVIAGSVCCIVLSIVSVVMRFYSRKLLSGYLRLDLSDWLIVFALIFSLAFFTNILVGLHYGIARHIVFVEDIRSVVIILLCEDGFHPLSMGFLKCSILALYYSIFPSRNFRRLIWAVAVFVLIWCIITFFMGVLLCIPIEKLWDPTITGGTCISLRELGIATTSVHIFTDLVLLAMPIPLVLRLNASVQKKRLILATFVVGGSVCIVSIARIPIWTLPDDPDISWSQIPSCMVAAAELTVGFLAASFPTYRPLYLKLIRKTKSDRAGINPAIGVGCVEPGQELDGDHHKVFISTDGIPGRENLGIMVTDDIELVRHTYQGGQWVRVPG
ncbi:hypothetical protein F4811DRAFT_499636 [Daldinia bambusicola]|nr:hypothetical protein F4811DRAFT_499636 [Daldinia bambusicola]